MLGCLLLGRPPFSLGAPEAEALGHERFGVAIKSNFAGEGACDGLAKLRDVARLREDALVAGAGRDWSSVKCESCFARPTVGDRDVVRRMPLEVSQTTCCSDGWKTRQLSYTWFSFSKSGDDSAGKLSGERLNVIGTNEVDLLGEEQ